MSFENRHKINERIWKVAGLGSSSHEKDIIPINSTKFKEVQKAMREKGYTRGQAVDDGMRYPHHSFKNLALVICKEKKIIKAEYESESALGQITSDFNLPRH